MAMYLLKFSACLLALWVLYVLFLERQKMHRFKRFYLLGSFVMALIIPMFTITEYIEPVVKNFEITPLYLPIEASVIEPVTEENPIVDLTTVLWLIYGLGVAVFSIRFVMNLRRLYNSISKNSKIQNKNFIYILLNKYRIPHSFFSYIFLHKTAYQSNEIPQEVLLHEETHAKQLHSLDILVIELLQIVMWFHPLVYLLKHHIKLNHEFLADEAVLNEGVDSSSYQTILLQFSTNTQDYQLSSAINYSLIKKRFTVMKTQTSKTRIWLSSLLLLPVCAILFYSFAEREYVQKETNDSIDAIAEELKEANKLDLNYVDGASAALMNEYKAFLKSYNDTKVIYNEKYERARIIYDDIMSDSQRASVDKYPDRMIPKPNLSKTKPRKPTEAQLEDFKDASKYAIWIDGEHVSNAVLNTYNVNDFVHVTGSIVHKNARSDKFPQPNQYHLYTEKGFKFVYQDSQLRKYKKVTQTYSNAIQTYLKGSQTDNSELRILKAKADKIYKSFSKEEIKKNNILPPPPVPAEKKITSQNRNSKGGPNVGDVQNVYNPSFSEYIIEMEQLGASFYLDDKKISSKKARTIAQGNLGQCTEMITQKDDNGNYLVKLSVTDSKNYQGKVTKEEMAGYNAWAKKIHSESKKLSGDATWYPPINEEGFKKFTKVYNRMSAQQKSQAETYPFPGLDGNTNKQQQTKLPPPPPPIPENASAEQRKKMQNTINDYEAKYNRKAHTARNLKTGDTYSIIANDEPYDTKRVQEKATKKQIAEYNAWAKEINDKNKAAKANKSNEYAIIKLKEVNYYKAIYDKMTDAQRRNAQPFPDAPPPPKPHPGYDKKTKKGLKALNIQKTENSKKEKKSESESKEPKSNSPWKISAGVTAVEYIASNNNSYDLGVTEYKSSDPTVAFNRSNKKTSDDYIIRSIILKASKKQTKALEYVLNGKTTSAIVIEKYIKDQPESDVSFRSGKTTNTLSFSDKKGDKMTLAQLQKLYSSLFMTYDKEPNKIIATPVKT
ncbi:MAG: M56 family metallopeptidase [Winogradskyella sp.]|nr:M56 family metallopeptidase [Winogradskyella sp.]